MDLTRETWLFWSASILPPAVYLAFPRDMPSVFNDIVDLSCNKPFMARKLQGFPPYAFANAHDTQEEAFKKTVAVHPTVSLPGDANTMSSHVIYKVKIYDDLSPKQKARIARDGNEDSIKAALHSDLSMCSPAVMRIIVIIASLCRWCLANLEV